MTKLTKSGLEQAKNNLIRSDGKGGLTEAEDIRLFQQHIIDTIFHLTDSTSLQKLIADLQTEVNQLQNQIADLQENLRNQSSNITDILQQIAQNQSSIGGLQQAITQAQTRINQLQSQANSNTNLIQSLQAQIDQLKDDLQNGTPNSQNSILTDYQVLTLSIGENVVVHNFNLSTPDAWQLSLKQNSEEVYALVRTRDKDSIFIHSNTALTVSIFITAKLD